MAEPQQPPFLGPLDTTEKLQAYLNSCPPGLSWLSLQRCNIKSLAGVKFPSELKTLYLLDNEISSLEGVQFPTGLDTLLLANNRITTLQGVQFPPGLRSFNLQNNPLTSLAGIIKPNGMIKKYFMDTYPHLYFRDIEGEKAARQSQKAESERMNYLSQQSMQNQLNSIMSFLREGMEARARQHDEQLNEAAERGRQVFFVLGFTRKTYRIPYDSTMTIQEVLDYLNSHYYISALEDCGVMQLVFSGKRLEPERKLADYNVQTESTLNLVCKFKPNLFQGGSKKRTKKTKQQRNKSTKKRT